MSGPRSAQSAICPMFERLEPRLLLTTIVGGGAAPEQFLTMPLLGVDVVIEPSLTITLRTDGAGQDVQVIELSPVEVGARIMVYREVELMGQATAVAHGMTAVQIDPATTISLGDRLTVEIYAPSPDGEVDPVAEPERVIELVVSDTSMTWLLYDSVDMAVTGSTNAANSHNFSIFTNGLTLASDVTFTRANESISMNGGGFVVQGPTLVKIERKKAEVGAEDGTGAAREDSAAPTEFLPALIWPHSGGSDVPISAERGVRSAEAASGPEASSGIFQLTLPAVAGGGLSGAAAAAGPSPTPINLLDRVRALSIAPKASPSDGGPVEVEPIGVTGIVGDAAIVAPDPEAGPPRSRSGGAVGPDVPTTDADPHTVGDAASVSEDDDTTFAHDAMIFIALLHGCRTRSGVLDLLAAF